MAEEGDRVPSGMFREIFDRLRETEAQTREQNTRITALCERLDNFTTVTDKFFELFDKRTQIEQDRFDKLWKLVVYLLGTVIALALGPKAAEKVYQAFTEPHAAMTAYALPMQDEHFYDPIEV